MKQNKAKGVFQST